MKRSITFDRLKRLVRESLGEDDLSANGDLDERFNEVRREVEDAQDYVYEGNYAEAVKHLDKALSLGSVLKDDLAKGELVGESTGSEYLCLFLYGDRAHYDPETMEIETITTNKSDAVDSVVDFFDYGPDDISNLVVFKVDSNMADLCRNKVGKDITEADPLRDKLLDLISRGDYGVDYTEFNGADYLDDFDDSNSGKYMDSVRQNVVQKLENL